MRPKTVENSTPAPFFPTLQNSCRKYCGKLPQRCAIVIHRFWVTNERGSTVDQDKLWQAVLGDIEITLSRGNYLTWFKNTQLLRREDSKVLIGVPNVFIKQ